MNHRATENTERKASRSLLALCALCLCGSTAYSAPENWPKTYNEGVAAYRTNDFAAAAQAFERALPATDRGLQAKALFNLGNASYRLGEAQPTQAQELWKRAIQHYEQALVLDPNDADAKFNREFVKKKWEELEKQEQEKQQQQQQQNQDQQAKEKQDQQQQQKQDSGQDEQQKQDQQQQQQPQPSDQQKQEQERQQQQEAQAKAGNEPFDKQQARALLDRMREEERLWDFHPELQMKNLKDGGEPAKDW